MPPPPPPPPPEAESGAGLRTSPFPGVGRGPGARQRCSATPWAPACAGELVGRLTVLLKIALVASLALTTPTIARTPPLERIGEPMLGAQRLPFSTAVPRRRYGLSVRRARHHRRGQAGGWAWRRRRGWTMAISARALASSRARLGRRRQMHGDARRHEGDWPAFNKVYVTYFPDGKFPARSAFGTDGLALGALPRGRMHCPMRAIVRQRRLRRALTADQGPAVPSRCACRNSRWRRSGRRR